MYALSTSIKVTNEIVYRQSKLRFLKNKIVLGRYSLMQKWYWASAWCSPISDFSWIIFLISTTAQSLHRGIHARQTVYFSLCKVTSLGKEKTMKSKLGECCLKKHWRKSLLVTYKQLIPPPKKNETGSTRLHCYEQIICRDYLMSVVKILFHPLPFAVKWTAYTSS